MRIKRDGSTAQRAGLDWWIQLSNAHGEALHSVTDPFRGAPDFAKLVHRLKGQPPEAVQALLDEDSALRQQLVGFGNDPDSSLWRLASIAHSILSWLAKFPDSGEQQGELVVMDWSDFRSPLIITVGTSGVVQRAYRPEPLASDLLALLEGIDAHLLGCCPICGRLFQRLRHDQKCDSPACRDTYRQRLYRTQHAKSRRPSS